MDRDERLARNEALFREVNERLEELDRRTGSAADGVEFVCECADEECTERITLTLRQYEALRAHPRRFVVLRGHEIEVEHVVDDHGAYLIVEKNGEAGMVAEETDPRS